MVTDQFITNGIIAITVFVHPFLHPHFWQCYRKMSFIGFKSTLSNLNKILAFVI